MSVARVDVIMPQMGESIAEGTVSKWLKKVGDAVKRDEPIFEISTDKVDAEIPAPTAGTLAEILVNEGQTVEVQTVVARLETSADVAVGGNGGPDREADRPAGRPAAAATTASGAATVAAASTPAPIAASAGSVGARDAGAGGAAVSGGPPSGAARPSGNGQTLEERLRTKSSPLVRKIAAEHGIELGQLTGSGVAGRVTKRDIESLLESGGAAAIARPGVSRPGTGVAAPVADLPLAEAWPGDVVEPMSKMRQLISDHMVASRRASAHVTSFFEIDLTRVARIRAAKRAEFEASNGQKLTYLPFIIRAVIDGLKAYPAVNASIAGHNVIYRKQYNIGIAVALEWGLIVPVIKRADELSLVGLTRALNDLAGRARAKRLQPEEVQDGTFTITNPGVFGSLMGTPIINQPQVAIMGVGAIEKRPKVIAGSDGEDTIAIRTCSYFSLSFDHRLIDGAVADQFLAFVKQRLETYPEAAL
jgi:pyruvate dehydrogenase E2 component (dihydrolipoamide acetyltransferase)